jgi:hypothetical protein
VTSVADTQPDLPGIRSVTNVPAADRGVSGDGLQDVGAVALGLVQVFSGEPTNA